MLVEACAGAIQAAAPWVGAGASEEIASASSARTLQAIECNESVSAFTGTICHLADSLYCAFPGKPARGKLPQTCTAQPTRVSQHTFRRAASKQKHLEPPSSQTLRRGMHVHWQMANCEPFRRPSSFCRACICFFGSKAHLSPRGIFAQTSALLCSKTLKHVSEENKISSTWPFTSRASHASEFPKASSRRHQESRARCVQKQFVHDSQNSIRDCYTFRSRMHDFLHSRSMSRT